MARKPLEIEDIPEVDALEGLPLPREQQHLHGHAETEQALLAAYRSPRLHHAWILGGPKGIGKATLAFRFARFIMTHPDRFAPDVAAATSLAVPPGHVVSRQIAGGAHPNILHLRRPWDTKNKRFKTDLPVDEIRRTVSFFGTTASDRAWRLCIVDSADEMNASSANALLKILEEPPERCLFLVLSHAPGRLLPTIRSRCRRLDMAPLKDEDILAGLQDLVPEDLPADPAARQTLIGFADGSLRSALGLLSGDGLAINSGFVQLADGAASLDVARLHALAEMIAARGQEDNWNNFLHVARQWIHARMRAERGQPPARLASWADLWEKTNRAAADAEALNLDRKQVVLDVFRNLSRLMRATA
ncbi:DNA polymerase III subunit delta' [Roseibium aestuarii]|uniref:DNA polymerase III subunit delta n=1 Tax=Roseibium aestuarii TaxID=2600299 RepID=A0ABW4JQ79_9HYPH|nr:DNA polymerase III subunit delta' [Roseibium aestuarii]